VRNPEGCGATGEQRSYRPVNYRPTEPRKAGRKRRKEKVAGTERNVTTEAPSIIVAALAYISKAQEKHAGDGEVTEMLGEIAAILGAGK
jgi:hypothetical protein